MVTTGKWECRYSMSRPQACPSVWACFLRLIHFGVGCVGLLSHKNKTKKDQTLTSQFLAVLVGNMPDVV